MVVRFPVPVICVVGGSGSGKTSLLERLIPELRSRGLRVGVVKHAPAGFRIDPEGKDSYRLREAGAEVVIVSSDGELVCFTSSSGSLYEIVSTFMGGVDLVLVEGFRRERAPKILVGGMIEGIRTEELIASVGEEVEGVRSFSPEDVNGITQLILDFVRKSEQPPSVELEVNGKRVPLNRFAARVVRNVVRGLISSLHGVGEPREVRLRIDYGTHIAPREAGEEVSHG